MKFPLTTLWLLANERRDLVMKWHIILWARDLAAGWTPPSWAPWLLERSADNYAREA